MKLSRNSILYLLLIGLLFVMPLGCGGGGGGGDDSSSGGTGGGGTNTNNNTSSGTVASNTVVVSSNTSGTVALPDNSVKIVVPTDTVPNDSQGNTGTMAISVEQKQTPPAPAPTGMSIASPTYKLGPDGFVLNKPTQVTMNAPTGVSENNLALMRYNEGSGQWEPLPFGFDPENSKVVANMIHFSYYALMTYDQRATDTRWVKVQLNNSSVTDVWANVCINTYSLTYPEQDSGFNPQYSIIAVAPLGEIGWSNNINWYIPQGNYTFEVTYYSRSSSCGTSPCEAWTDISGGETFVLTDPDATYSLPLGSADWGSITSGRAPCLGTPTPAVGTGDVQITLSWDTNTDLDLHVTDPVGTEIYFGNKTSASGGQLDLDNSCGNFILGRPENIFWPTGGAPSGTYTVAVEYYSDCAGIGAVSYNVRVVVGGNSTTYSGTISADEIKTITTFTIQ